MTLIIIIIILALICLFLIFYKYVFLRDPPRIIPKGNNIVSPADGKVIDTIRWGKEEIRLAKSFASVSSVSIICKDVALPCTIVSIFMSPLDVHVNRVPCDGKVISIKYSKGKFRAANTLEALQNERNEVLLSTKFGKVKVVQIAGFIARRIECWLKPNQKVIKGMRFGRINLGSQVVIVFPSNLKVKVTKGQKVRAGETIIALP